MVTEDIAQNIGADYYTEDAMAAVRRMSPDGLAEPSPLERLITIVLHNDVARIVKLGWLYLYRNSLHDLKIVACKAVYLEWVVGEESDLSDSCLLYTSRCV